MSAFFVAGCDGAEIFQSIDGTLDDISALVSLGIKARRCAASASFAQAALSRILTLGANATDASGLNLLPIMAGTISAIDAHGRGSFPWSAATGTRHADGVKHMSNVGRIAALASGDKDRQWQAMSIYAKMDLAGDAAA